jgi:hypothetical protein
MTSAQEKQIECLSHRMSKAETSAFANRMACDGHFRALVFKNFTQKNAKQAANLLWCSRSLPLEVLASNPNFCYQILAFFHKFPDNQSILRDGTALLQSIDITENLHGQVFEMAFGFLQNRNVSIAVKVFSMSVAYRIAQLYPELLPELSIQIQENVRLEGSRSPAIFSRGTRILTKINRRSHK